MVNDNQTPISDEQAAAELEMVKQRNRESRAENIRVATLKTMVNVYRPIDKALMSILGNPPPKVPRNSSGVAPVYGPMGPMPVSLMTKETPLRKIRFRHRNGRKNGKKSTYTPPRDQRPVPSPPVNPETV